MRTKLLRGLILDFLHRIYPHNMEKIAIIETFYKDWKPKQIEKSLGYLRDKGYVEEIMFPHPVKKYEKITVYKITPDGIDVLEKTKEDNGITIYEEE